MNDKKPQFYFLLVILTATIVLVFFTLRPFLQALVLAMIFAVVFQPLQRKILAAVRGRQALSALLTTLLIIIFILTPIIFLGVQIAEEAGRLYNYLISSGGGNVIAAWLDNFFIGLRGFFSFAPGFSVSVSEYFSLGLNWLLGNLGAIFSNVAKILMSLLVFLIALYYLLKDGSRLKALIVALSPLSDTDDEAIMVKLERAVNSVIRGSLLVAIIQGLLTAVGFLIFGVPNAVFWGTITAVAALIPGVGTALVLVPAVLFLFFTGKLLPALGLLAWGVGAVGLVDNFLGPKLVGRGARLHPLLVLLSVLGGISFFGPVGFLLGPLTVSLLLALLEIYLHLIKNNHPKNLGN